MDAQFDVLNNLIAQNKASSSEMRKRMSGEFATQAYKDQMINAEQQIQNAPGELEAAQKAYYTSKFGLSGYQDFLEKEAEKKVDPVIKSYTDNFEEEISNLQNLVDVLSSQTIYTSRMNDIRNNYVTKEKDLENKVLSTRSKKNVNDRLASFYNRQIDFNIEFTWYLNKLYWGLIIVFVAAIIYNGQYKNKLTLLILVSLILIVFVGRTLREWIQIDVVFKKILEYFSQVLMYITFGIRVLLDKLF
tara:strand:- start:1368 stop:2105 length:738 start_codon:yes stop_codon:yes gene_type:complete